MSCAWVRVPQIRWSRRIGTCPPKTCDLTKLSHNQLVEAGKELLEAMGLPYLYYEQTFGGHANDADPELNARRWARHYVYLTQKLMD